MAITNSWAAQLAQDMNNIAGDWMGVSSTLASGNAGGAAVLYVWIAIVSVVLIAVLGLVKR